ncbi:MAG: hypothetical protein ABIH04_00280 [Planctomycetota bacterium]
MLKIPKGTPTEKDILGFNLRLARERTLEILEEIKKSRGLGKDVLTARPTGGDCIGVLLCRIVALEWDVVNRLHKIVKKPSIPGEEVWPLFLGDNPPTDAIPDPDVIFSAMDEIRAHLIDVLRSSSNAIMDTVLVEKGAVPRPSLEGTARFYFIHLPQHESALSAQIQLINGVMK